MTPHKHPLTPNTPAHYTQYVNCVRRTHTQCYITHIPYMVYHTLTTHMPHTYISFSTKHTPSKSSTHVPHHATHQSTCAYRSLSHQTHIHKHTLHHTTHVHMPHTHTHAPPIPYHTHMPSHTKHDTSLTSPTHNTIWLLATSSSNFHPSLPCLLYFSYIPVSLLFLERSEYTPACACCSLC